jgi:hypothetical protein
MPSLSVLLDQVDSGVFLPPKFQRGDVWNRDQVRGLLRSLDLPGLQELGLEVITSPAAVCTHAGRHRSDLRTRGYGPVLSPQAGTVGAGG